MTRPTSCAFTAILLLGAAAMAGCGAKIFKEEVAPRINASIGMQADELARRLGPPERGDLTGHGDPAIWTDTMNRYTREPIRNYINGRWVTIGHRVVTQPATCTITATIEHAVVTALTAKGAASLCVGMTSKIVGY